MWTRIVSIDQTSNPQGTGTLLQRTRRYDTTPIAVAEGPVLGSEIANKIKRLVLLFRLKTSLENALHRPELTVVLKGR